VVVQDLAGQPPHRFFWFSQNNGIDAGSLETEQEGKENNRYYDSYRPREIHDPLLIEGEKCSLERR
jgi:hypothetical protein